MGLFGLVDFAAWALRLRVIEFRTSTSRGCGGALGYGLGFVICEAAQLDLDEKGAHRS